MQQEDTAIGARRIAKYPFSFGAGAQSALQVELNPDDLSHALALVFVLEFTTIGTDAGDTFDLKFQDTNDRTQWNTRARFSQVLGTSTAAAGCQRLNLQEDVSIASTEQAYTEAASGASEISKGTVRNGPILGFVRTTTGRQPGWRMQFDVVDAGTQNGTWVGTVTVWADDNLK